MSGRRSRCTPRLGQLVALGAWLCACTERNPAFFPTMELDAGASGTGGTTDEHESPRRTGGASGSAPDADAAPEAPMMDTAEAPPEVAVEVAPGLAPPACPAGWACLAPGSFAMGSPSNEPGRDDDETQHQVTLTRAFWLQSKEVTQAEYQALMGNNPSDDTACGPTCPAENFDWYHAIALANAASLRDGHPACYLTPAGAPYDTAAASKKELPTWPLGLACTGYRLPTEAEWEYAARAATTTPFPTGAITKTSDCNSVDPALGPLGWYCANGDDLHPVGLKQPNPWSLYDMNGNVWEWLWDQATADQDYPTGNAIDPLGPTTGTRRRDRGGSYHNEASRCRAANRDSLAQDATYSDTGVRLARTAP